MSREAERLLVHVAEVCRGQRPIDDATRAVLGPIAELTADLGDAIEALHLACKYLPRVVNGGDDVAALERIESVRTVLELRHGEPVQTACEHGLKHMGPLHPCDGCCTLGAEQLNKVRLEAVRAALFAPLDVFRRFGRMKPADVCNRNTCTCRGGWVAFITRLPGALTDGQTALRERIRAAAPEGANLHVREHAGKCNACPCERVKIGVQVSVEHEGEWLMLEYALDEEGVTICVSTN